MLGDVCAGVRFYSRLPVPVGPWDRDAHAVPDFRRLAPVVPVVGVLVAVLPAAVLWVGDAAGLGHRLAAACCVLVVAVTTGAFHEDGLADTADSFGAMTVERRLEVMRDSRIGTFGATALLLFLLIRVESLAVLLAGDPVAAVTAVLLLGAVSRTAPLLMLVCLPPARSSGLAAAVGVPGRAQVVVAWSGCTLLAVVAVTATDLSVTGVAVVLAASLAIGLGAVTFARRHVGGHTGDISGACQQVTEVASLLALAAW